MKLPNLLSANGCGKTRPMTPTETSIFIDCMMQNPEPVKASELTAAVVALDIYKPGCFGSHFTGQVMIKRLQQTDSIYDPCMIALAVAFSDTPGAAVLWAYTLFVRGLELGHPYTIDDFAKDFPLGPPTDEGACEIWDAQKKPREADEEVGALGFPTDNILDTAAPWQADEPEPAAADFS